MFTENDLAIAYEMGAKEASDTLGSIKRMNPAIPATEATKEQILGGYIKDYLGQAPVMTGMALGAGGLGLYHMYKKNKEREKYGSFNEYDLATAYEMGVKEAASADLKDLLNIYANNAERHAKKVKLPTDPVQRAAAVEAFKQKLKSNLAGPERPLRLGSHTPISWYQAPGAAIQQEALQHLMNPEAGAVTKGIAKAFANPYVAHSILPAAIATGTALAGYGAHQYFKNKEDSEEKAASFNEYDLAIAYEMGVKEAAVQSFSPGKKIQSYADPAAIKKQKQLAYMQEKKKALQERARAPVNVPANLPSKAEFLAHQELARKAEIAAKVQAKKEQIAANLSGPERSTPMRKATYAPTSWYQAPGAAIQQEALQHLMNPEAGAVTKGIAKALANPYVAHSILPAAILATSAAGYGAHQYFKNKQDSEEKAASLYETVYNDFRNQNLREISAEWESLVQ